REKQKGSRGIRRGQRYRLVFQFPIREQQWQSTHLFFGFLNFRLIKPLYPFNFCQRCGPV
ncbi:hypothetical protein C9052_25830, partial (plasmid) [Escherichia coli]